MQCGLRTRLCIALRRSPPCLLTPPMTLTRMLDAGAAGTPVCHCPADSPGEGSPGQYTKNSE